MELSNTEKLQNCKYNCLQLACNRFKKDEDGMQVNLDDTEVLAIAEKFYNYIMGNKNV